MDVTWASLPMVTLPHERRVKPCTFLCASWARSMTMFCLGFPQEWQHQSCELLGVRKQLQDPELNMSRWLQLLANRQRQVCRCLIPRFVFTRPVKCVL